MVLLAAIMQYVRAILTMRLAFVSIIILGTHTLDAVLGVHSAQIVQDCLLVLILNASIRAKTHVACALVVE